LFSGAAPTVVSFGKTVGENAFFAFTATTFTPAFTDPDASDTLQAIKILTLPTHGTLTLTVNDVDTAVTAGQEIAATDILNLKYTPTTNFIGTDSLSWNGSDGTLFAITSATLTFNVTVPTITNFSKNVGQNSSVLFTLANFTGAYSGPNPLISIQITALPVHGTLTLVSDDTSTPVTLNQEISAVDVAKLTYTPAAGYTGSDTFKWTATDGHSTSAAATVTLAVKAPVVAALSQIVGQNVPFTFAASTFANGFTSPDTLASVKIVTLPTHGTLALTVGNSTTPVTAGQEIPTGQLANLKYTPAAGYFGKDSFKWTAAGAADTFAATPALFNISVRAYIIQGNGVTLESAAAATEGNFTDFGYASTGGPVVTRTYTIKNLSDAPLNLTNAAALVKVVGTHAADFTVTTPPAATVAPGESTTFTVTFNPHNKGNRVASLVIPTSAAGQSPFTIPLKGTGVDMIKLSDNLQVAQTKAGIGPNVKFFNQLVVDYTGYLTTGLKFDSSLNPGRQPLSFVLGRGDVIQGWDEGLQGIKKGETRILVVPPTLAYGSAGQGNIPPNATLIFVVKALAIAEPKLVLRGSGNKVIAFNDSTPSTDDGTDFGVLGTSTTSVEHTFKISNAGSGQLGFTQNPAVTFTGANAADFSATGFTVDTNGASASTVVTFHPTGAGVRTAIMHIHTNDPSHPDYTFTVRGSTTAYTDLTVSLGAWTLPGAVAAGTAVTVPLVIKNIGALSVPADTPTTDVSLVLHDPTNALPDIPLNTFTGLNVANLGLNATKAFNLSVTLPAGYTPGTYQIVAAVNAGATVVENNYVTGTPAANNAVTGRVDLQGTLASTLPTLVVGGAPLNGKVTVTLANGGNVALPANQQVTIQIVAHDTVSNTDVVLTTTAPLAVGSLKPGTTKSFTVDVAAAAGVPNGSYQIRAVVTPVQALAEGSTANNTIAKTVANANVPLTATDPFVNLTGTLTKSTLPATVTHNTRIAGNLTLTVRNTGNIALPAGQQIRIQIIAHIQGAGDTTGDVVLTTSAKLSVAAWAAGKTGTFTVPVAFAAGLAAHTYVLEAKIVPEQALTESNDLDNLITLNSAGQAVKIVVT
jgi:hypothetical protein